MIQKFTIPGRLPGKNEIRKADRTGWKSGNSQMREAKNRCIQAIEEANLKPFSHRVSIGYTWIEPNQRRDPSNVRHGDQFIQDALVACGIIKDDGPRYVGPRMWDVFECDPENPRIEVEITDESE